MTKVFYICLICFICGMLLGVYTHSFFPQINDGEGLIYNYKGAIEVENLSFDKDTIYTDGANPYGVYNIVPNEEIAVWIAEKILFHRYGKNIIISQRPYEVSLLNDYVWKIGGTLPRNTEGGCFHIFIDKRDGRILQMWHEK